MPTCSFGSAQVAIKSQELRDLDAQLNGALADIVSLHSFKGKPVRGRRGRSTGCVLALRFVSRARAVPPCPGALSAAPTRAPPRVPAARLQGSSQTVRCGGSAKFVTLCGLGPADKLKVTAGAGS